MPDQLRKQVIRLAAENPKLQPLLLPLLKQGAEQLATKAAANKMAIRTKAIIDELADLTYFKIVDEGSLKASRHADSAAKHLVQAHKALVLLSRNL